MHSVKHTYLSELAFNHSIETTAVHCACIYYILHLTVHVSTKIIFSFEDSLCADSLSSCTLFVPYLPVQKRREPARRVEPADQPEAEDQVQAEGRAHPQQQTKGKV